MTVEIIIASVIAFSIAFFLMEITMKLVDVTDNEYADTNFMTDKALIITNVKKYVEDYLDDVKSAVASAKNAFYVTRQWRDMSAQESLKVMLILAYIYKIIAL